MGGITHFLERATVAKRRRIAYNVVDKRIVPENGTKFRFFIKSEANDWQMACIENDRSEMAADLKRDFLAGGVIAIFFMPRLEEKSRSHAEA